jgi:hypothetical protein
MSTVILRIFKHEGIFGLYRGFWATMLNTFSMRMYIRCRYLLTNIYHDGFFPEYAYFFFYSWVRSSYIKRLTSKLPPGSKLPVLSTAAELMLGAVAGALAQIFTIPVAVIATRQQVGRPENPNDSGASGDETPMDDSFMGVAREIIAEEGVTGLWLGLKPGLVLTVNPAITYGVFERVKSLVLMAQGNVSTKMSPWLSFIIGALSKTLATIVSVVFLQAFKVNSWFDTR